LEKVTEIEKNANALNIIFVSKAARVFAFGLVSIMTPVYVATLGYSPFYVGLVLAVIIAGNIASNITITRYGKQFGDQRALLLFSILMLASGAILSSTTLFPLILFACFLGNISTTGTEAGPFQSIETAILPNFALQKTDRTFGLYNLIGYASSAVGAKSISISTSFSRYFRKNLAMHSSRPFTPSTPLPYCFTVYLEMTCISSS